MLSVFILYILFYSFIAFIAFSYIVFFIYFYNLLYNFNISVLLVFIFVGTNYLIIYFKYMIRIIMGFFAILFYFYFYFCIQFLIVHIFYNLITYILYFI